MYSLFAQRTDFQLYLHNRLLNSILDENYLKSKQNFLFKTCYVFFYKFTFIKFALIQSDAFSN